MTYEVLRLTDRQAIRAFLSQDRRLAAYALGDLDDALWPDSQFYGARIDDRLDAVLLLFTGLEPPVLTAFGDEEGVRAILNAAPLPQEIYYLFVPSLRDVLAEYCDLSHVHREWRMVLAAEAFHRPDLSGVARLEPDDAGALAELYRHAAEPGEEIVAFTPEQIAHGVFYGVWNGAILVATAGTHVWSQSESVVAIGNVFTMPEYRGRGYATLCTAAVTADALAHGLETVVLNVRTSNAPAMRVYEKLGYKPYALFLEGPGLLFQGDRNEC